MNLNLPNRQRWLVIIAGAGLLLLVLDRIVFTPLGNLWQAHATEIVQLGRNVANGTSLIGRADQTGRVWAGMEAGALPAEPAQAEQSLIASIDRWGRASSIEVGSIKPQWKRGASDRYSLLECRIEATGTQTTLSRFLYELEKSPLALRIDSVELSARDDRGQKLGLNVVVSGLRLVPLEVRP
jgi:hypothetical protein